MNRIGFAAIFIIAITAMTGCSGSTPQQPGTSVTASETSAVPVEATVTIDGKEWTCEQITASEPQECSALTQQAFDQYKDNIEAYVSSGKLGPINQRMGYSYEDITFAGLAACAFLLDKGDQNDYIAFMKKTPPFDARLTLGTMYLPAWFEAQKTLCPDLDLPNQNPGSNPIP